jgi:hypothetical protein
MGHVHPFHRLLQVRVLWCLLYCTCPGTVLVLDRTAESPRPSSISKHPGGRRGLNRTEEWRGIMSGSILHLLPPSAHHISANTGPCLPTFSHRPLDCIDR